MHRESIEWCDAWLPNMNDHALPRVMLIGDSITRGYYGEVQTLLKDKAYVARIATSKAIGDPALLTEIRAFLGQARFDVVHFNIGMHGWAYSEDEYRTHFPELVDTIRKLAPGAKLIFATTTPVRKDANNGPQNDRILTRNTIARAYATRENIALDDLHTLMLPFTDLHTDDVHFSAEGSRKMAAQVAESILKVL